LPLEALGGREEANLLAGDWVGDGLFRLKVLLPDINGRDALDTPANAQVGLLMLPVFGEDGAPQGAREPVDRGERAEEEP